MGPTIIGDRFRSPLIASVIVALPVLGLPRVVDLEAPVELLSAGRQQLDVCEDTNDHISKHFSDCIKYVNERFSGSGAAFKRTATAALFWVLPLALFSTLISPSPTKTKGFHQ